LLFLWIALSAVLAPFILGSLIAFLLRERSAIEKGLHINESAEHFVLKAPKKDVLLGCLLGAVSFGAFSAVGLFDLLPIASPAWSWVIFLAFAALAILFTYFTVYHLLFETRVMGNELCHRELFHRKYTFTFQDIQSAQTRRRKNGDMVLTLYAETETLLLAEEPYIGYDLLVARLAREGVEITKRPPS